MNEGNVWVSFGIKCGEEKIRIIIIVYLILENEGLYVWRNWI